MTYVCKCGKHNIIYYTNVYEIATHTRGPPDLVVSSYVRFPVYNIKYKHKYAQRVLVALVYSRPPAFQVRSVHRIHTIL